MTLDNILNFIVIVLLVYTFFIKPKTEEPKDISIYLIVAAFGILATEHLEVLSFIIPNSNISTELTVFDYVIAFTALISGIYLNYTERKQYHVFNLLGENNKKELIDNNYKVKNINTGIIRERSIDFMRLSEGEKMTEEINESMKDIITSETTIINNYATNNEIYLTSMASIPHTILFGSYLTNSKTIKHLNYNNSDSQYVLLPNEAREKKQLNLSINKQLNKTNTEEAKEVLVSISGTFTIHEEDILDLLIENKVSIETNNTVENNITSQKEIIDIANEIVSTLIELSKTNDVIHIVAAISGMLSIELGRKIKNRDNQLKEIIVYHYNAQSKPKYIYGIVVNGIKRKGEFIERGI